MDKLKVPDTIPGDDGRDLRAGATDEFGPAMRSLTEKQRNFVYRLMEFGGRPSMAPKAAEEAGYKSSSVGALRSQASHLLRHPKIIAAVKEEADRRVRGGAILAASVLIDIASDPTNKNQFKAAVELLNRADLIVASRQEIVVDDKRPDKQELQGRVQDLAERLGIDPAILLEKQTSKLVDVTPSKVDHTPDDKKNINSEYVENDIPEEEEEW